MFSVVAGEGETGLYTLRPGNNLTISIALFNGGNEADFSLSIDQLTSGTNSTDLIVPSELGSVMVGANETEEILVRVSVPEDASDGQTSTFTVLADSSLDDSNDFVVFKIAITTRPPPEFTGNVSGFRKSGG